MLHLGIDENSTDPEQNNALLLLYNCPIASYFYIIAVVPSEKTRREAVAATLLRKATQVKRNRAFVLATLC